MAAPTVRFSPPAASVFLRSMLALMLALIAGTATAATYNLPARIGTSPFANCSLQSGTTYSCTGSLSIGNADTINFTGDMTLAIAGSFQLGNNANMYGNGHTVTIKTGGDIQLGNSFVGSVNFEAGGNFSAGNTATITGNISADGNISTGNGTNITGDVDAGGNLSVGGGTITGTCTYTTTNFICTPSATLDHVRFEHSGTGITCMRESVIVKACQDSACSSLYTAGSVSLTLSPSGGWYAAASGGTASNTLTFTGSATRYFERTAAGTYVLSANGVSPGATNGVKCYVGGTQSCNLVFSDAGFIVSATANGAEATIPAQTAGTTSSAYQLRAVKTGTTTKACEAALTGTNTVNFAYECVNPPTCHSSDLMYVNDTAVARNANGSVSTYAPVNVNFDVDGNASFTFRYEDAGRVRLHMAKAAAGSLLSPLSGSTTPFVVRPAGFTLASTCTADGTANGASQATPGPGDPKFCRAGAPFGATVTAVTSGGNATPNYGRESPAETAAVTWSRHLPTGAGTSAGTPPSGAFTYNGSYSGAFSNTALSWDEIGILAAAIAVGDGDYLGAGNVTGSAYVGRFYPHHFDTTVAGRCGGFAYSGRPETPVVPGQPFSVTVTARNAANGTTVNYAAAVGYAKAANLTVTTGAGSGKLYVDSTEGGNGAVPAAKFVAGAGTVNHSDASGRISFVFGAYPAAATSIALHAEDADTGTSTGTDGTIDIRAGRLRLFNAVGSERSPLAMAAQTQFWSGNSWVLNGDDTCTSVPANAFALSGTIAANTSVVGAIQIGVAPNTGGNGTLMLAAPSGGATGSVDVAANLGTAGNDVSCLTTHGGTAAGLPWLRSRNGNCASSFDRDPSARATFGVYTPETRRTVHVREQF